MRALVQRVTRASVTIAGSEVAAIERGLLVLLGVGHGDTNDAVTWLAGKIARLRVFADDVGKMNRSVADIAGSLLVVSQFTLYAEVTSGNRPSFTAAALPALAQPLYERFVTELAAASTRPVATGVFAADMQVALINDGPVTLWYDSAER
jgi:D-aminoacyl-tRNA deacylase